MIILVGLGLTLLLLAMVRRQAAAPQADWEHVPGGIMKVSPELPIVITVRPTIASTVTVSPGRGVPLGDAEFDALYHIEGPRPLAYARFTPAVRALMTPGPVEIVNGEVTYTGGTDLTQAKHNALTLFAAVNTTPADVLRTLVDNFAHEPHAQVRLGIVRVLTKLGVRVPQAEHDTDPQVRVFALSLVDPHALADVIISEPLPRNLLDRALEELSEKLSEDERHDLLLRLRDSLDWQLRILVARLVRRDVRTQYAATLRDWAAEPHAPDTFRYEALCALHLVSVDWESFAQDLLRSQSSMLQLGALDLLGRSGTPASMLSILQAQQSSEQPVRDAALEAAARITARLPEGTLGAVSIADEGGQVSLATEEVRKQGAGS